MTNVTCRLCASETGDRQRPPAILRTTGVYTYAVSCTRSCVQMSTSVRRTAADVIICASTRSAVITARVDQTISFTTINATVCVSSPHLAHRYHSVPPVFIDRDTCPDLRAAYYRQHCAQRKSAGISFTQRPILRFFAPQGRHVAPIGVKFDTEASVPSSVPNFTPIGATTRV